MPLESLGQKDEKLNIKRVETSEPQPKSEELFDLDEELTEEQWRRLLEELEKYRAIDNERFAEFAVVLVELFPERRDALNISENVYSDLLAKFKTNYHKTELLRSTMFTLNLIQTLFPDKAKDLKKEASELCNMLVKELDEDTRTYDWINAHQLLYEIARTEPERVKSLDLTDAIDNGFLKHWKQSLPRLKTKGLHGMYPELEYIGNALMLKLLFPEEFTAEDVKELDWKFIREQLAIHRSSNGRFYASMLNQLNALTANSATLTNHGIVVERKHKIGTFKPQTPPLPELKK